MSIQTIKKTNTTPVLGPIALLLGDHHFVVFLIAGIAAYLSTLSPVLAANIVVVILVLAVLVVIVCYFIDKGLGIPFNLLTSVMDILTGLQSTAITKDDLQQAIKLAIADLLSGQTAIMGATLGQKLIEPPPALHDAHAPQGQNITPKSSTGTGEPLANG